MEMKKRNVKIKSYKKFKDYFKFNAQDYAIENILPQALPFFKTQAEATLFTKDHEEIKCVSYKFVALYFKNMFTCKQTNDII